MHGYVHAYVSVRVRVCGRESERTSVYERANVRVSECVCV